MKQKILDSIIGQKFGKWTVIRPADNRGNQKYLFCICDCGKEKEVNYRNLISGKTNSCGCNCKKIDLTNKRFGKLKVLYEVNPYMQPNGKPNRVWHCICDCGNEKNVLQKCLSDGSTKSCGCTIKSRKHMDLTGQTFGGWTVLNEEEPIKDNSGHLVRMWRCRCNCEFKTEQIMAQNRFLYTNSSCKKCARRKPNIKNRKTNMYDLTGEYGIGYDSNGNEFWFDLEDYNIIKDYCWIKSSGGYFKALKRDMSNKDIQLHRLILGIENISFKKVVPDHIGGKNTRHDNRKCNLRIATQSENKFNIPVRSNNATGITGVCWSSEKKMWRAYITLNKKQKHLGYFKNLNDAIEARINAEDKYFGEYSYSNSQRISLYIDKNQERNLYG